MVCVAPEPRCECIVRDITQNQVVKFEVTLPASTPVQDLFSQVANKMKYEPNSFQLNFQATDTILTENTTGSLESAGFSTIPGSRNSLVLEGIGGNSKTLVARSPTNEERTVTSPTPPEHMNFQVPAIRPATASPATEYTFPTPVIRHETGYVGLVNQAMTCYLNSLLQALYMTPEFRNALYKWKFDPDHSSGPNKCIPYQLQKLFLNLQTSTKTAVETTELTRSFGWESGEVWQQHDIQELCRVMFDALEQEFKETEQADLINQLYQGKMIDYVKCLECNSEKSREDTFLDIPLPVRPFGSTIAYASIEEALRAFVQPETLDGNNQYLCDKCEKKCDAHKGLKFTKFPYLLTLHLKRFDFDYNTMHRIKLNDKSPASIIRRTGHNRHLMMEAGLPKAASVNSEILRRKTACVSFDKVVFPEILNLNSFVNSNITNEAECEAQENSLIKNDDGSIADSVLDEDTSNAVETQHNDIDQEEDEGIDVNSGNNHENEKNRQQSGPFIYELYSIMIHSGSASGGHYYAYIKDFAKNEWYCFNDQTVTSITLEDIQKTYGGTGGSARGYYSGAYSSSTNAYMLMYRQINQELNRFAMVEEEFPPHIKKLHEELKVAEEREKAIKAKQDEMARIKLYANHPILGQPRNEKIYCQNEMPVGEVKEMAYRQLKLEGIVPIEQCRLVLYNKSHDEMEESWDDKEKDLIGNLLTFTNKFCYNCELLMEIRDKNKKFLPYNVGDIRLTVYVYNGEERAVGGPEEIRTSPCQTLSQLKKLLQDYMQLKTDELHVVLVKPGSLLYINSDDLPLNRQGFTSGNLYKIFISYRGQEGDLSDKFEESELYKQLDEVKNVITLQIYVPDTKKETLELLLIPPLNENGTGDGDKQSDSTPTGEGLPLTNGIQEEELGYGSGAGMSDQSASEDSSLTDSDRTIIGEVVNEGPLSSPSDSDQQLSSSDSQTVGKPPIILNNEKKSNLENNDNICHISSENDESNIWNPESTRYYFRATPYTTEEGQEMLRIVVDKATDVNILKEKLEKFLGVDCKYMKLLKSSDAQEISSLRSCRDDEKVVVKLERVLSDGEHRIGVNHLIVNAPAPIRHICDWIVSDGDSIASLKKALLKEVDKRACLKIPYERCRLRKQTCKNPGAVLLDSEVWDEGLQQEVYLQELEGPDPVTDPSQTLIFTRRWHPGTTPQTLDPFREIVIDSNSSTSLSQRLSEISGIPVENVKFAKGKLPFPGESGTQLNDLMWESDYDNSSKLLMNDWERENGAVAFYRDDREEIKNCKEEKQGDGSQESNASSNTFSYISGYSPRKERALKIYRETPRRNPRSVIDVD